jgi:hypothetical protein
MNWADSPYYEVSCSVHKCRRYHAKLRDFYQGAYNWTVAGNAITGSAAFVAILASNPFYLGTILSGVFAVASSLEAIFKYETKARAHHDLSVRFTKLAAEIEELQETPDNLARVRAERLRIEADEPAEKRLVEIMASNDELRARGVPESKLHRVSWCQSKFGYIWTWGLRRLEREKSARESAHV